MGYSVPMEIVVARRAGFCSGVRRAVDLAMEATADGSHVITCGPLVHNPQVTDLLARRGASQGDDAGGIRDAHALIRSHGLAPGEEKTLRDANPRVTDATCVKVKKVQEIIAGHARNGYLVVIAGEPDHPEVRGLSGYAGARGRVVSSPGEAAAVDLDDGPLCLVAQTTQEPEWFRRIANVLNERAKNREVKVIDTICNATRLRQQEALEIASTVDRMIVVGGKESGNTRRLVQVIENAGTPVDLVEDETQLDANGLAGVGRIGVTAGASTPTWSIDRVVQRLNRIGEKRTVGGRIRRVVRIAVVSSAFSSLAAGVLAYGACVLMDASPALPFAALAALYLFAMQVINRMAERGTARFRDDPDRMDLFARFGGAMRAAGYLAAGAALALSFALGVSVVLLMVVLTASGVLYAVPVLPGRKRPKDLPASKNAVVAAAWTAVTVLPPVLAGKTAAGAAIVMAVGIALAAAVRSVHLDLADIGADKLLGRNTIPTVLGEERTQRLKRALTYALAILIALASLAGTLPAGIAFIGLFLLIETFVLARRESARRARWRTELLFDLHLIAAGIIAAVG